MAVHRGFITDGSQLLLLSHSGGPRQNPLFFKCHFCGDIRDDAALRCLWLCRSWVSAEGQASFVSLKGKPTCRVAQLEELGRSCDGAVGEFQV